MRLLAALGLLALAGCGLGDDGVTIGSDRLDGLLLQPQDIGPGYRQTIIRAEAPSRVRYERTSADAALDVAESMVWALASEEAADMLLEEERGRSAGQPIDEPGLGDESFAVTSMFHGLRQYRVLWREHNAAAVILVRAGGELAFSAVLALARKQERRIAEAGG